MLQLFLGIELLALELLEWRPADKYLEEGYTEGPDIGLASVVEVSGSTFRRQILRPTLREGVI